MATVTLRDIVASYAKKHPEIDLTDLGLVDAEIGETCDLCDDAGAAHHYTFPGLNGYFSACYRHVAQRAVDVAQMLDNE